MMRVPTYIAAMALLLTSITGCQSAPVIREVTARPQVVCPGDTVYARFVSSAFDGGRMTATPAPLTGDPSTLYSGSETDFVSEISFQICETTRFDVTLWNGGETGCGENYTTCDWAEASVAIAPLTFRFTADTCGGPSLETAVLDISDTIYGSFVVQEVRNCTERSRPVRLRSADGTVDTIAGGGTSSLFSGSPLTGAWTATRNVIFPEGCPRSRVSPDPVTPPPTICLEFLAGCADNPDCASP